MASPDDRHSTPPSTIPQKRALGDESLQTQEHAPAIPSPLNPDAAAKASGRSKAPPAREQREKKESLKKREANEGNTKTTGVVDTKEKVKKSGGGGGGGGVGGGGGGGSTSSKKQSSSASPLPLLRYHIPRPKPHDFTPPTPPVLVPGVISAGRQFYETTEQVFNRKGFRYIHCIADPGFPSIQYHRQSETEPFYTRFDYSDSSQHIHLDQTARCMTTEKGFRMTRANVCAREGRWYWECKILSGIKAEGTEGAGSNGHVRLGFSRREASLETPVGFDAYSYGLRDASGQKVHMSRPKSFMTDGEEIREGDVIGLEIDLPGLALHRKVVEGSYNKAVDVSDNVDPAEAGAQDIIRDRLPIRYKSHLYFESFEYQSTKDLEDLMNPSPVGNSGPGDKSGSNQAPYPNHPHAPMRTLPNSCIKVYKNGKYVGTPFKDLLAFLPPASKPAGGLGQVAAREGLDDGMLGYFPSVSVFRGGAAEANFGPDFWYPPEELLVGGRRRDGDGDGDVEMGGTGGESNGSFDAAATRRRLRPMAERYDEQIAEDITYDVIDEVDLWSTDGNGKLDAATNAKSPTVLGPVDPAAPGLDTAVAETAAVVGDGRAGEIKEIVQDDE